MRRAAVAEKVHVELHVLAQALFVGLLAELFIAVFALGAGGDFGAAPDQVVAQGHAVLVAHMVEGALFGAVVRHKQEFMAEFVHAQLGAQALGVGGQVVLFAVVHLVAVAFFQLLVHVGQLHFGEGQGGHDGVQAVERLDLVAVLFLHALESVLQHLGFKGHHVPEGGDVAHFHVKAGELGGVLVGEGLFGAEYGAHFKDAVKARSHGHLLVELGALAEVGFPVEVFELKHVGAAFAGRADQLGGVDFHEVLVQAVFAHGPHQLGLGLEDQGVFVGPQVDPAVVHAAVDGGVLGEGQRLGNGQDLHFLGQHFLAAHLHVFILHHGAHAGDDGFNGQLIHDCRQVGVLFLFNRYLQPAAVIPDHQESHGALVPQVLHEALNLVVFAADDVGDKGTFHVDATPFCIVIGFVVSCSASPGCQYKYNSICFFYSIARHSCPA